MSCHSLPQGTAGSNPGLPYCRQILYHLSQQGSPKLWQSSAQIFPKSLHLTNAWELLFVLSGSIHHMSIYPFLETCFHFLIADNALIDTLWQWDYTCLLMYIYQACPFLILPNMMASLVALEKEMAIHSSILAWRLLWTEELGRLQSMGLQRTGHDWATNTFTFQSPILRQPCVLALVLR